MRRTVTILTSFLVLWASSVYAEKPNSAPQNAPQQAADQFGVSTPGFDKSDPLIDEALSRYIAGEKISKSEYMLLENAGLTALNDNSIVISDHLKATPKPTTGIRMRPSQRTASDLIFSEYAEGSSNNKYIEIYNGTGADVDLSSYVIMQNSNGGPWNEYTDVLSGTLAAGDVYVIANGSADASILAEADLTGSGICYFNGDDARALIKVSGTDTTILDYIGTFPDDPGSGWDVAGVTDATKDHTLVRKSSATGNDSWAAAAGTNTDDSEWTVYDQNEWAGVGWHTMLMPDEYLSEGFEIWPPSGWTLDPVDGATGSWAQDMGTDFGPGSAQEGTYCAFFNDYDWSSGTVGTMTSPALDLSSATTPRLVFYYWDSSGSDDVVVKVSTDGSVYTTVYTTTTSVSSWTAINVDLTSYIGNSTVYVQFEGTSVWGVSNPHVDNVVVEEPPQTPVVNMFYSGVNFLNVTTGDTASASNFGILSNTGGGTLNLTGVTFSGSSELSVSTTQTTVAAGGTLYVDLTYMPIDMGRDNGTITVTSDASDSPHSMSYTGKAGRYLEGWEGSTANYNPPPATYPYDWTTYDLDGSGYTFHTYNNYSGSYGASGNWHLRNRWAMPANDWLITPELDLVAGDSLLFYARNYSSYSEIMEVYVSTTGTDVADFTTRIDSVEVSGNVATLFAYDLSSYVGGQTWVAIRSIAYNMYYLQIDEMYLPDVYYDTDPNLQALTSSIDFGGTVFSGATETFSVTNVGLDDLVISAVSFSDAAFTTTTATLTVAGGDTGGVDVTFNPTAEQDYMGYMVITSNSGSSPDSFMVSGSGIDAVFYEDFGPWTGDRLVLPTTIPQYLRTWYHDQYGVDPETGLYTFGNGAMTAYIGGSNSYHADETLITPQIDVSIPSKVTFWMYNNYDRGYEFDVSYSTDGVTYTALGSFPITNVYTQHSVILPETGNQYVAFTFAPDSGGLYTYFNFDQVEIRALPNTHVTGFVTDSETGDDIAGATVQFGGATDESDFDGYYWVNGVEPGTYGLNVSADGYLDSYYTLEIDIGDTLSQNVLLVSESSASQEVYSTGFESGDDMGWTYTGGTNPFELSAGFTFYEDYYYYYYYEDDTMTVAPFAGDSMMVCSPTGYANSEFSWWMNLTDANMDLSGYTNAEITLQMNYATEAGYDFIYLLATWPEVYGGTYYYLDVNGDGFGNAADGISGSSSDTTNPGGWVELTADLSNWTGTDYGVEVAVLLVADATVDLGFGVAIDDVVVNGFTNPRPWVADLAAESFVNDQIALTWSDPTGGNRTVATNTITMNRTPVEIDPRNPRKAFEYEIGEEELTIDVPASASRDLLSYSVFRTDQYYFSDYSGFDFITSTTDPGYTDTTVVNHSLYYYYVTAVYEEGESFASPWAAAGAGEVTDVAMADVAIDFEDSTLGNWEVLTFTDNGWEVGETNTGFYGVPTHPDGGLYAFVNDDAAGSAATSESRLVSPFFNMGDADHAAITFDYFNGYASQEMNLWAWIGWDSWISLGALPANSASGWQTVSVDLSSLAGLDHIRLYAWYADNGFWAGSVAMDNISVSTWDGPTALTLAETTESVTLHWTGLGGRAAGSRVNEYPDGVSEAEKLLASDLNDIRNPGQIGQHGEDNFSRVQGDSIGNPFVIDALPFYATGTTVGFTDDYDEVCPYTGSTSPDVVYQLTIGDLEYPLVVDICESYYDSKVYMYSASDTTNPIACNDDFCTASHGQAWTSYLEISPDSIAAGTYYIVIDGYGGGSGDYVMSVYEAEPPPPPMDVMYNVYRDGNLIAGGLADSVTSFLDAGATLLEACYVVTASVRTRGLDGDTLTYVETGYSNEACGSVVNQPPGDFTLLTPSDGDTIMITGDNISSSQIFAWNASVDPNGTPIEYEQCVSVLSPFDQFCEDAGSSTAEFVPLTDFADYIDSLMQAGLSNGSIDINWTVYASDGMDDTEASNGPRALHIDAGWALGVNDELGIPDVFALHQNYPNPFNPVTSIRFDVPEESRVLLDIYNVTGQKVATLVNGNMQPGFHSIRWNGTNEKGKQLASGMYFYRISSSKFTEVKKLILMK